MDEQIRSYAIQCANEDAEAAILHFEKLTGVEHDTVYVDDITYQDGADGLRATMTFAMDHPNSSNPNDAYVTEVEVGYWEDGDELACSHSPEDIADELVDFFKLEGAISGEVEAATTIAASTPIMAAGEDDENVIGRDRPAPDFGDDMFAEDVDDDDIADQLDDMSDTLDNMQEDMEEIEEDDVSIEMNNNIENHYIAECDKCQGIFISSIIKSDQYLEKVSGICPLCNKESDQYLKWMVTSVE